MKPHWIDFPKIVSFFWDWKKRKQTSLPVAAHPHIAPVTTTKGIVNLCCNIIRKKELYLRAQAQRLHPVSIQYIVEPGEPDGYKGLRIETREYTLWCQLCTTEGNPEKEPSAAYCRTVIMYFYGSDKVKAFMEVLKNKRRFRCIWENRWLDLEEKHVKIILKISKRTRIPHCMIFDIWNE
ncbi:MAG: hypothetical protein LUF85_06020 [Bacteroides sp.]|nr:hypothetical protein [Bacteroides sp.]